MRLCRSTYFRYEGGGLRHVAFSRFAPLQVRFAIRDGAVGLLPGGLGIPPEALDLRLAGSEFRAEPCQFGTCLIAFKSGGYHFLAGFDVLQRQRFERFLSLLSPAFELFERRLQFREVGFEA